MTKQTVDRGKEIWHPADTWEELSGGLPVYRGFTRPLIDGPNHIAPPTDRQPKNIPLSAHRIIDQWFADRFGFHFRTQALFGSGSIEKAEAHSGGGEVGVIRPNAEFMFCWSPHSYDLLSEYEELESDDQLPELLERLEFTTEHLDQAVMSGNEIMIASADFIADRPLQI